MSYLWFLVASLVISFSLGIVYFISIYRLIKKLGNQDLLLRVVMRWRKVSIVVLSFALMYFFLRTYQFTSGIHDDVHMIIDVTILALLITAVIISRKNLSILRNLGGV